MNTTNDKKAADSVLSSKKGQNEGSVRITGAEALMRSLEHEGVETLFGYPGGAIMPTYDALYDYRDVFHHVLVRHEQGNEYNHRCG